MMNEMSFFESKISVTLLPRYEADFLLLSSSIRIALLCPFAPLGAIDAVRQPFIPPFWFFLLQSFRVALALDLLLCSFHGSCWCCYSLSLAIVFLCCSTLIDTGLVILVEVVCDETKAKVSREAASFPSVFLRSLHAPLTDMHDNRGVGGLVHKNAEGMTKVSFLSLGGLILMNLGGLILLILGGLILLNISLVGLVHLLVSR